MLTGSENLDPREREKFDALADEWWDLYGPLRTLHHINPARMKFIEQSGNLAGKQILDIGCGGGVLSEALAARGASVTGIDISERAIAAANRHKTRSGLEIEYEHTSAAAFADSCPARFDVITCMELLEHVPDCDALIKSCKLLLKPGGDLFLATINRNAKSYLAAIFAAEYLLRLLPRGTHDYARFIKPAELQAWLQGNGFKLVSLAGITYLPGLNHCILTNNPAVNYIVHAK